MIVLREVECPDGPLLRIVDVAGDMAFLPEVGPILKSLLLDSDARYADLVMSGVDHQAMHAGGFVSRSSDEDLVLPNYFDPFVPKNVQLEFAFKTLNADLQSMHLHLADTDQDRPNS